MRQYGRRYLRQRASTRAELAPGRGSGAGMLGVFVREIRMVGFLGLSVADIVHHLKILI